MKNTNRAFPLTVILSLVLGAFTDMAWAETSFSALHIYAGPQTVAPGQVINVSVEAMLDDGGSASELAVTLTYNVDGQPRSQIGKTIHGLASFDVPAQTQSGLMSFFASVGNVKSNEALVLTGAGQPIPFKLNVMPIEKRQSVLISTDVITDEHGNPVSDQSLVTLDWLMADGLKASQHVQLFNGQIIHSAPCPIAFAAPLKLRATLKNIEVISGDMSDLCQSEKG